MNLGSRSYCFLWKGTINTNGYGVAWNKKTKTNDYAHRIIYRGLYGKIPVNLEVDHLCRNRACINPNHLELVTPRENTLRGISPPAQNAKKLTCVNGHSFSMSNTRYYKGHRSCRTCHKIIYIVNNESRRTS